MKKLNNIFTELYNQRLTGCWSTNYSQYTEQKDMGCSNGSTVENTDGLLDWSAETQEIVNYEKNWVELMSNMEKVTTH